jgi:hypothetical protein
VLWAGWPQLFRSENSGRDWTNISSSSDYRSISYRFPISDTQIYARGTNDFSGIWDLLLIDTVENSYTKLLQLPNEKTDFSYVRSMFATNEHTLWMVGKGGKIIKYTRDSTVQADHEHIPNEIVLHQNHPNPFNNSTTIDFFVGNSGNARLDIYDVRGSLVSTLLSGSIEAGFHSFRWEGDDGTKNSVASSGVYVYVLSMNGRKMSKKMLYLR